MQVSCELNNGGVQFIGEMFSVILRYHNDSSERQELVIPDRRLMYAKVTPPPLALMYCSLPSRLGVQHLYTAMRRRLQKVRYALKAVPLVLVPKKVIFPVYDSLTYEQ